MANKNKKYKRSIENAGRISDEDKSTSYITTEGAGYIPHNYGQGTIDYIRKKLYDNVQPWGYNDIPKRIWNAIVLNKTEPYDNDNENKQRAIRDDLWATYLQIPYKNRHNIKGGKVTLERSTFKPKGAVEKKDTYKFKQLSDAARQGILAYTGQTSGGLTIDALPYLPLNTNILEKKYRGEEISLDNGKNISEADGYKDLIFTPAISTPMFNYYHLVYLIRESYLLVPAILNYSQDVQNLFMLACAYQQY